MKGVISLKLSKRYSEQYFGARSYATIGLAFRHPPLLVKKAQLSSLSWTKDFRSPFGILFLDNGPGALGGVFTQGMMVSQGVAEH